MEMQKRKNNAPNVWLILIWHHFCFYKRHKVLLFFTICLPMLMVGGIYYMWVKARGDRTTDGYCAPQAIPLLSAGPTHFANIIRATMLFCNQTKLDEDEGLAWLFSNGGELRPDLPRRKSYIDYTNVNEEEEEEDEEGQEQTGTDGPANGRNSREKRHPKRRVAEHRISFNGSVVQDPPEPPCIPSSEAEEPDGETARLKRQANRFEKGPNDEIPRVCYGRVWARRIYYYPNSGLAQKTMQAVAAQLALFRDLSLKPKQREMFLAKSGKKPNNLVAHARFIYNRIKRDCFLPVENLVLGFPTRKAMFDALKEAPLKFNWTMPAEYYLWAGLNLEGLNNQKSNRRRYVILRNQDEWKLQGGDQDLSNPWAVDTDHIFLQDLVEMGILKAETGKTKLPMAPMLKHTPRKCVVLQDMMTIMMRFMMPMITMFAFYLIPVGLMEQLLTEKQLKLRDYLAIMGVSDFKVKMSWFLFYGILLLPMCFGTAYLTNLLIPAIPGTLLLVMFLLYNMSLLSLCYLLSSLLSDPKRVSFQFKFTMMLLMVVVMAVLMYGDGALDSVLVVGVRLVSFICPVPFMLAMSYAQSYQKIGMPATWGFGHATVNEHDRYGGFGEAMLWLVGDFFLYLVLGWYMHHVMPGEYGVQHKLWFFVEPSFWLPKQYANDDKSFPSSKRHVNLQSKVSMADREAGLSALSKAASIIVQKLSKQYSNGKFGVKDLNLTFHRGEISTLLGQNGAGKSTMLNCVVGLLTPTSGRILIEGLDTRTQIDAVRQLLGFVPQYDIQYPSMTVEEHVQFFGWLKGLSLSEIRRQVRPLMHKMELAKMNDVTTTSLSGGQKRKLSVLTAYLGEPQVIILDEPTTGVDPVSRRTIWEVLLRHRSRTATILSTHFMDEADLLSDRIAVISSGRVRCVGGPMYIKNQYGKGHRIILATDGNPASQESLKRFFKDAAPGSQLSQTIGNDIIFTIPKSLAMGADMSKLLLSIEKKTKELGVVSFGVSEPNLEDAFFASAGIETPTFDKNGKGKLHSKNKRSTEITYVKHTIVKLYLMQLAVLLMKRALLAWRSLGSVIGYALMGLSFIALLLLLSGSQVNKAKSKPQILVHMYDKFRHQTVLFFQDNTANQSQTSMLSTLISNGLGPRCPDGVGQWKCAGSRTKKSAKPLNPASYQLELYGEACLGICVRACSPRKSYSLPHWLGPGNELVYQLPTSVSAGQWALVANQSYHLIAGGIQLFNTPSTLNKTPELLGRKKLTGDYSHAPFTAVVWTAPNKQNAMLNAFNNLQLQHMTNKPDISIELIFEDVSFPTNGTVWGGNQYEQAIMTLVTALLLSVGFIFSSYSVADAVQYERSTLLKDLQIVHGVRIVPYWVSNFIFDYVQYLITLTISVVLLASVPNALQENALEVTTVGLLYGMHNICFVYAISQLRQSATGVNTFITVIGVVIILIGSMVSVADNTFDFMDYLTTVITMPAQPYNAAKDVCANIGMILRVIPYYFVVDGFMNVVVIVLMEKVFDNGALKKLTGGTDLYQHRFLGHRMVQSLVTTIVLLVVVVVLEYRRRGYLRKKWKWRQVKNTYKAEDPDVRQEEQRVLQSAEPTEPVVVKQVQHKYPNAAVPAVVCATFGIPRAQCFGLLGLNGAGKSTLFRILAGFQAPTAGEAWVEQLNVVTQRNKLLDKIGYCPQENTLFDRLTIRDHLHLFASLAGVPWAVQSQIADALIDEVGLTEHDGKRACELSGGNQRKLNFAVSLIDYKPVVFLDEPTSGMDPGARRRTWNTVTGAVSRGCSVVLTSHSMEECEALCHRLVIMSAGVLRCIGSVQYLKGKFGGGYSIKIKLRIEHSRVRVKPMTEFIVSSLAGVKMTEKHPTMLYFKTDTKRPVALSLLQNVLCKCRQEYPDVVEDFAYSQVSLENVFLQVANEEKKAVPKKRFNFSLTFSRRKKPPQP